MRRVLVALLFTLAGSAGASAQICTGFATFDFARARLFADAAFSSSRERYHGGAIYGGGRVFGSIEAGMTTYTTEEWLDYGAGLGVQLGPWAGRRLQLCPQVGVASSSSTSDLGSDHSEKHISAGVSVGYSLRRTRTTQLAPTATLLVSGGRSKVSFGGGSRSADINSSGSIAFGLGFQFDRQATVVPSITVPFGTKRAGSTYGIRFSITLGSTRDSDLR